MRCKIGVKAAAWSMLLLTGCGTELDVAAARKVWQALDEAYVARPIDVDYFRSTRLFRAPIRCQTGSGTSSVLHTQAWALGTDSDDGELTGNVAYTLRGCRTESKIAFDGKVRRTFHALHRSPPGAAQGGELRLTDEIFGSLQLMDALQGTCEVDVTRVIVNGEPRHTGTVCGHDAARLLGSGHGTEGAGGP